MSRRPLKYRTEAEESTPNGEVQAIRGPNSALTEFLRQQGISAEQIRQRHLDRTSGNGSNDLEGIDEGEEAEEEEGQARVNVNIEGEPGQEVEPQEEDREELEIRIAARRKRRAAAGKKDDDEYTDSDNGAEGGDDDDDDDFVDAEDGIVTGRRPRRPRRKVVGEEETCADCFNKFVINVYSKVSGTGGYMCPDCTKKQLDKERALKKNQLLSRKKRQKLAVALLDRQDVKLPSLQDLAIKKVTERIYDVDELGDIGDINMKKISRILCKNRSLDDNTLKLFLESQTKVLEFWDCSALSIDAYRQVAAYCPQVESLTFLMCGRLHNDNLNYFGSNLSQLSRIELDGPFLINNDTWQNFFNTLGPKLKSFKVSNTHRFSDETFQLMLEKCGENMESLKLSRLDGIKSKASYDLMPAYLTQLQELEISYPHHEDLIEDSLLINLLSINGESLKSLTLDGCTGLTDEFLITGIRPFGANIRHLSLQLLDQITSEGFVGLFHEWEENLGMNEVNLRKCFSLGDEGVVEMLLHSATSLVELSINSIKDLTPITFQIMKCPNLTYLDCGFVRSVDDLVLELIGTNCSQLKLVDCYGNNRCTGEAKIRDGLKVIGRQSDTV